MNCEERQLRWMQMKQAEKELKKRQFSVHCYAHVQECRQAILAGLENGVSVSVGGSTTLKEMKILDDLRQNQRFVILTDIIARISIGYFIRLSTVIFICAASMR